MNIYYYKKIYIDIPKFWREIGRIAITPMIVGILWFLILEMMTIDVTFSLLVIEVLLFSSTYIPVTWFLSLNQYERNLFSSSVCAVMKKIRNR